MTDVAQFTSRRWPFRRLMRVAFLAGLGWSHEEIAADVFVRSTAATVKRHLNRMGLSVRSEADRGVIRFTPARPALVGIESAAALRHVSPSELMRLVGDILGREPALLDNILDDQK